MSMDSCVYDTGRDHLVRTQAGFTLLQLTIDRIETMYDARKMHFTVDSSKIYRPYDVIRL